MQELIIVKAKVQLFAGEGMRQNPFADKYRPLFTFKGAKTKVSGSINLLDRSLFYPGTTATINITFIKGILPDFYFRVGEHFVFSENVREMGEGEIIEIEK